MSRDALREGARRKHRGRRPATAAAPTRKMPPFPETPMTLTPELRTRIEDLLQANRVVRCMKGSPAQPRCGFSAKAAGILDGLLPDYGHVDVLADPEIREGIKLFGQWPTIPQLYVDGELLGGSDIIEQM